MSDPKQEVDSALVPTIKRSLDTIRNNIVRMHQIISTLEEQTTGAQPVEVRPENEAPASGPLDQINSSLAFFDSDLLSAIRRLSTLSELVGGEVSQERYEEGANHGTQDSVR